MPLSRIRDKNKKVNGRKRFIVTDTLGLLLIVCVMAASVQDRDGAKTTLLSAYLLTPVRFVYADAGFAGVLVDWCQRILRTVLEIVRKAPDQKGFAAIPRRWVVERTLAWLTAHRRLARDYELPRRRGNSYYSEVRVIPRLAVMVLVGGPGGGSRAG